MNKSMKLPTATLYILIALISTLTVSCHGQTDETLESPEIRSIGEIPLPDGFKRTETPDGSFGSYLRSLPLKPKGTPVYMYNGDLKEQQDHHYRVIDTDSGNRDLLQCADAVMKFRAEYLYSRGRLDDISFNFTSGDTASFRDWIAGKRPVVSGNDVSWTCCEPVDSSFEALQSYLDVVYMYAGTYSLKKELIGVDDPDDVQLGDIMIIGGFPGHAMIVADLCRNGVSGETAILFVQGFTPSQNMHVVANERDRSLSPWYIVERSDQLTTPSWTFDWSDLQRFPE